MDAAVASVGRMLVDHVQCALEALALQLGDALGLAACSAWMAPLSLQVMPPHSHGSTKTNLLMLQPILTHVHAVGDAYAWQSCLAKY